MDEAADGAPNALERWRWNDAYWSTSWLAREQLTSSMTASLLERLAPQPGERVLDVGSGAGATALEVARRVGPLGEVVGADLSEPLVAHATAAAAAQGIGNARFVLADVQTDAIDGAPFTVAMSQFGVMFFEDPIAAFTNVRRQLVPGSRLAFVCWRTADANPWFAATILRSFLPPPAPPAPGSWPTGPFAFGEEGVATSILAAAGFEDPRAEPVSSHAVVDRDAVADEHQAAFLGVPPERIDEANAALFANLERFARDDGRFEVPTSCYVVTARTPR